MGLQIAGVTVVDDDRQGTFNFANVSSSTGTASVYNTPLAGTFRGFVTSGRSTTTTTSGSSYFPFAAPFVETVDPLSIAITSGIRRAGSSSEFHGYAAGGITPPSSSNTIQGISRFSFTTSYDDATYSNLTAARNLVVGHSSITHGFTSGGNIDPPAPVFTTDIERYPFANEATASNIADITQARGEGAGLSSITHGYNSGGRTPPPGVVSVTTIDKFSFTTGSNGTLVGSLVSAKNDTTAISSPTAGYTLHGINEASPTYLNGGDKFPFATDSNAVQAGTDYLSARIGAAGLSSTTTGYHSGGFTSPGSIVASTSIWQFPWASDSTSVSSGGVLSTPAHAYGASSQMD